MDYLSHRPERYALRHSAKISLLRKPICGWQTQVVQIKVRRVWEARNSLKQQGKIRKVGSLDAREIACGLAEVLRDYGRGGEQAEDIIRRVRE